MKKLTTAIGWLLVGPFAFALAMEIYLLAKIVFANDAAGDMGYTELAYGSIFLALTGIVALVGETLVRRGRGRDMTTFIAGTRGAVLGLVAGLIGGVPVMAVGVVAGTVAGVAMVRRRRNAVDTIALQA